MFCSARSIKQACTWDESVDLAMCRSACRMYVFAEFLYDASACAHGNGSEASGFLELSVGFCALSNALFRWFCVRAVCPYSEIRAMAGQDIQARLREVLSGAEDETRTRIENLERERAALAAERKRITKEVKKEAQKRKRLVSKARNLSIDDLMEVAISRSSHANAKAKAKAKARAS